MTLADLLKMTKPGQSESEYKADIREATKVLVQLGVFDSLDSSADLVEAIKEIIQKSESREQALYGEVLDEDQLRSSIAEREEESRQIKAKIDALKETIAAAQFTT